MKILQINSVCGYGSTGKIVNDIYYTIEAQGNESLIAFGRGSKPDGVNAVKISSGTDNRLHGLLTRVFDKHGFGSVKATKNLVSKIKEYNPDIIHLHNLHGYYLNIQLLFDFLLKYNKPVVWTLHDCWPITGHCAHFDYVKCEKWKTGCFKCPQKTRYPASYIIDNSETNYKRKKLLFNQINKMKITVPSKWMESIIKKSFLCKYPINIIYNGIDIKKFKSLKSDIYQDKYGIRNNKHIILGVSNIWDDQKGLEDFLSLSKLVNKDDIIFLIGLSKKQIRKLPDNVIGIKRTENIQELVELYANADVLFNPSKEETFGLVTAEAMACGTPVIVYNSTASPELIGNRCGYSVRTGDLKGVIDSMDKIKKNGKDYYSNYCIEHVTDNFNRIDKINEYIKLYHSLLSN